jgi:endonuclease VIII
MPEGDALHRAAARVRVLEGHVVSVEARHPRAAVLRVAERIDGRRLERVEAVGKNLLLTFEGGLVLRSHLRMKGRWRVQRAGDRIFGNPWLVVRGGEHKALLFHGPVLELTRSGQSPRVRHLGPDVMLDPPDVDAMLARVRAGDPRREIGEALLDQRVVGGIGNKWKAEGLFLAGVSPWAHLGDLSDDEIMRALGETSRAMRDGRPGRLVYRRAGMACRRCGTTIRSSPQGDDARIAYWCTSCQSGP